MGRFFYFNLLLSVSSPVIHAFIPISLAPCLCSADGFGEQTWVYLKLATALAGSEASKIELT